MHYETKFRERVISYVEMGNTITKTSELFSVTRRTIYYWIKLKKETGSLVKAPAKRSPKKLIPDELLAYVDKHPDAYLHEIGSYFQCCVSAVFKALRKLKITYKKSSTIERAKRSKTRRLCKYHKKSST